MFRNLEIFGGKHSPNHLELKYENRFQKGVKIGSQSQFKDITKFLKNPNFKS